MTEFIKVMIAGVGGASLGTEIFKALQLSKNYVVYGCDISSTAYGLYTPGFAKTYRIEREDYERQVINVCLDAGIRFLIPGAEEPMMRLSAATDRLAEAGICFLGNDPETVALCSNKNATFHKLTEIGVPTPRTMPVNTPSDIEQVGLPCVIKPTTGTGGSASVFFAVSQDEAMTYAEFIRRSGHKPLAQEYIDIREGEFTVGVLSLPDGGIIGSIALKRDLTSKLSSTYRGRGGIISSGYSQGYIDEFSEICRQAEAIAQAVNSRGPVNIQGRVRNGVLLPFEINPRFSASTYLRAMAGFNEVDLLLRYQRTGKRPERPAIRPGWYLRSLTEQYVPERQVK